MAIEPTQLLTVSLPAAEWNFVLQVLGEVPLPHQPRANVLAALNAQLKAGQAKAEARQRANDESSTDTPAAAA